MLANPFGQPDHDQTLAAALGVPDDTALPALYVGLRRLDAEILVVAADLLDARIEDHKIMHDLKEPLLVAELAQFPKQWIVSGSRVGIGFFPA